MSLPLMLNKLVNGIESPRSTTITSSSRARVLRDSMLQAVASEVAWTSKHSSASNVATGVSCYIDVGASRCGCCSDGKGWSRCSSHVDVLGRQNRNGWCASTDWKKHLIEVCHGILWVEGCQVIPMSVRVEVDGTIWHSIEAVRHDINLIRHNINVGRDDINAVRYGIEVIRVDIDIWHVEVVRYAKDVVRHAIEAFVCINIRKLESCTRLPISNGIGIHKRTVVRTPSGGEVSLMECWCHMTQVLSKSNRSWIAWKRCKASFEVPSVVPYIVCSTRGPNRDMVISGPGCIGLPKCLVCNARTICAHNIAIPTMRRTLLAQKRKTHPL